MIVDRVLGIYAAVGGMPAMPPAQQAVWYDKAAGEWGINTFEFPLFGGTPLAPELLETFVARKSALVVTLVAQWAGAGQKDRAYGLSSTIEASRQAALLDTFSVIQQCQSLSQKGIRIRNLVVQTGQRVGATIPHAIAFYHSLQALNRLLSAVLPECRLTVEPSDCRPAGHPIPFPVSKKSSLNLSDLIQTLTTLNAEPGFGQPVSMMVNWGRLLINGEVPSSSVQQILESQVPLAGVILSGAGPSKDGFRDSHNSHLDPESGFTADDARACALMLRSHSQSIFLGMKCSRYKGTGELSVAEVLAAEAALLGEVS